MNRSQKIGIAVLVAATLVTGYGVYWWHEAVLDDAAVAGEPSEAARELALEVRKQLAATDFREKAAGLNRFDKMATSERAEVLVLLADDREASVRLVTVPLMGKLKDRYPPVRAALARLAGGDPDKDVRESAREALGGGGVP